MRENFEPNAVVQSIGFAVFIFCVGIQAGPAFFGALREDGARYVALAAVVAATATVLAVVLSPRRELAQAPGNVLLAAKSAGLPRDAVVNVAQVVTLKRSCLSECVGRLDEEGMAEVTRGLRLVAGLVQ